MKPLFMRVRQFIKSHSNISEVVFLILIFSFSLVVRRIGLKFGFPLLTHPDEGDVIIPVVNMTIKHSLNPGEFAHPDHILQYLNLIFLNLISFIKYGKSVAAAYDEYYLNFYFYSRLLVSILGSLIPIMAYKIGKEIKGKLAVTSALVFAFFPLYANHSLYITPDIPITLFTLLVTYFSIRYLNRNKEYYLFLAVFFSAVSTAEKYPGLLSFAIVLAAIGIQITNNSEYSAKQKIRTFIFRALKMGLFYLLSLFIVAPFLFLEYQSVIAAISNEARSTHLGSDGLGFLGNLWFYIQTFFSYIGILGTLLVFIGVFSFIKRATKKDFLLLFGFFYWIVLSILALHWERWALPMYIAPLFLVVFGINFLQEKARGNLFLVKLSVSLIIALFFIQQSVFTIYFPVHKIYTDTRYISLQYCEAEGITVSNTIYEGNSPLRPSYSKTIFDEYPTDNADKTYLILSSFMYNRYQGEPERYTDQLQIYNDIRAENTLLIEFDPTPLATNTFGRLENVCYYIKSRLGLTQQDRYSGPTIEIYELSN